MSDRRVIDMGSPEMLALVDAWERRRVEDAKLTELEILDRFLAKLRERIEVRT